MEECGADWEHPGDAECPEYYREHEDFWKQTMQMRIHDTVNGEASDISLAVAIDLMFPCNWNFVDFKPTRFSFDAAVLSSSARKGARLADS